MKYLIAFLLVMLFATQSFSQARAVWRSSNDEDTHRKSVVVIDMGQFKDNAFSMNNFVVSCIDGVKVFTTSTSTAVHSIIIPGTCDGKPPAPQYPKLTYPKPQKHIPVRKKETKEEFLTW